MAALNLGDITWMNLPLHRLTAPKQAMDLRVGAWLTTGSPSFGGNPHSAARAVLLEVAFVQAPQLNVIPLGQPVKFF